MKNIDDADREKLFKRDFRHTDINNPKEWKKLVEKYPEIEKDIHDSKKTRKMTANATRQLQRMFRNK